MRFIIGLFLGVILSAGLGFITLKTKASDMMFLEHQSPYGYKDTVEKVKQSFLDNKWSVMSVKDSSASFVKKGKDPIGKLTNMKVCAGKYAYALLKDDVNKHIASMMPCGVAIYEKEGKVYVSTMNLLLMQNLFSGETQKIMKKVADDTSRIMEVLN